MDDNSQLAGTKNSATDIYQQHGAFIRKIICAHINDKSQADDIFQDFFLHMVAHPLPGNIEHIESYLYRAVLNCLIDATRHTKRYQGHLGRYARQWQYYKRVERSPETPVINAEETQKMFQLIEDRLSPREASAVMQRYKQGCDTQKAAANIGVSKKSVSKYVSVGLHKFQQFLAVNKGEI